MVLIAGLAGPFGEVDMDVMTMVVGEDDAFRWSTVRMLEANGYSCLEARDGEEALTALDQDDVVAAL